MIRPAAEQLINKCKNQIIKNKGTQTKHQSGGGKHTGEMVFRPENISKQARNIHRLALAMSSTKLNMSFSYSSGYLVDTVKQYSEDLNQLGIELAKVFEKTAKALDNAAIEIKGDDDAMGSQMLKEA